MQLCGQGRPGWNQTSRRAAHDGLQPGPLLRGILRAIVALLLAGAALALLGKVPTPDTRAIVSTASRPVAVSPGCSDKTLRGEGIGKLEIGADIDSVNAYCRVVTDTLRPGSEGMMERSITVAFPPTSVDATVVDGIVWRLAVESPDFRTPDGLGVGSKLPELLRLDRPKGMVGEGILVVVSPAHCGLSFVLTGGIPPLNLQNLDKNELSKLPRSTRVEKVFVVGCQVAKAVESESKQ